jgi:hypothetical protein
MALSAVPQLTLYKVVSSGSFYINMVQAFLSIYSAMATFGVDPQQSNPIDEFAFLYTCCGNDFCQTYCSSEDKDNGIRFPAIVTAHEKWGRQLGPYMEASHAGAPLYWYGAQQIQTPQYTVRLITDRVRALMHAAYVLQQFCDQRKAVSQEHLLRSPSYMHGQVARAAWCMGYYANAAVPLLKYAKGDEVNTRTGLSVHGWAYTDGGKLLRTDNVHCSHVHANGDETLCPTPIDRAIHQRESAERDNTQSVLDKFYKHIDNTR